MRKIEAKSQPETRNLLQMENRSIPTVNFLTCQTFFRL
uniref:Uncharacterized protein n=1 Tax=Tetraselmis sp. GSL018 TaxID=582737 RepID=A0A061SDM0_9CHLO